MEPSLPERLRALWDHLGLTAAHVATQVPADLSAFAQASPERIAGLVFCVPTRLDAAPFLGLADRVTLITGDRGLTADVSARAASRLAGAARIPLADYDPPGWADVVAERTGELLAIFRGLGARHGAGPGRVVGQGVHAGISYSISGTGPALVLLPFFLAPSQWQPAIAELSRDFTVIVLGGKHLGGVAALEDRAQAPSYQAMFRTLIDTMDPKPGEAILDVGCGSGALDRLLATRLGDANAITATDLNPFLLREADALAVAEGATGIDFRQANAEALPFADASFDFAFSITVLEECDADRALAEICRVLRPRGRAGIVVRAIDVPQWWNLDLPAGLRAKADIPPQSVGARGVADASLYKRIGAAGFAGVRCFPTMVTLDRTEGPIWRYREDAILPQLSAEETAIWRGAVDKARAAGTLCMAHVLHCVVGTKPAPSSSAGDGLERPAYTRQRRNVAGGRKSMAMKRMVLEIGMGTDIRGTDYTKAAVRALRDALWHNSLSIAKALGKDTDDMYVEVHIGVPKPHLVDKQAVLDILPHGTGEVHVVEGGLEVPNDEGTGSTVLAQACAVVKLDV